MADNDPLHLGRDNSAEAWTTLRRTARGGDTDPLEALIIENPLGSGVVARAASRGMTGEATDGPGMFGSTTRVANGGTQGFNLNGLGVAGVSATGVGVQGLTTQGGAGVVGACGVNGIGVHGRSPGGTALAGLFDGTVKIVGGVLESVALQVNGSVDIKGNLFLGGTIFKFRIDHPLDPENKYLYHSLIESPDRKNVYDGVIDLDAHGAAEVTLPEYFEALNKDFRYQLTPIGRAAPNLHIAEAVSNNRFKIGGGMPNMQVSWQVTGIRQDRWAEAHRTPVEEDKPPEERGCYLHPELYGESSMRGIGWAAREEDRLRREEYERWMKADRVNPEDRMSNQELLMEEHRRWVEGLEQL